MTSLIDAAFSPKFLFMNSVYRINVTRITRFLRLTKASKATSKHRTDNAIKIIVRQITESVMMPRSGLNDRQALTDRAAAGVHALGL